MKKIDENYFKVEESMKNNRIEDLLDEGEAVLWREKPNKKAYIWSKILGMLPIALIWLLFDGLFIGVAFTDEEFVKSGMIVFLLVFMAIHLMPVWIWIGGIIKGIKEHKNIEYAFTDRRIIIRSGFIGIDFKNIYYSEVSSVNVKVGVVDRILKVGDVYIKSNNSASVLCDIRNPYEITSRLQKITMDIKTDIYYPNALRPDENMGYNTKYKGGNNNG